MVFTLSLPEKLESQLNEVSNQKGESLESIILTAISYYVFVYKDIMKDLNQKKHITKQRKLEDIHNLRGSFKGCLSSSDEFAQRKQSEKELEL